MKFTVAAFLAAAMLLSGCSGDPTPRPRTEMTLATTRIAYTRMGAAQELNGCRVQAYRAFVEGNNPDFTLATAQCPTAMVVATQNGCGKNCTSQAIQVYPQEAIPAPANSASVPTQIPTQASVQSVEPAASAPDLKGAKLQRLEADFVAARAELARIEAELAVARNKPRQ